MPKLILVRYFITKTLNRCTDAQAILCLCSVQISSLAFIFIYGKLHLLLVNSDHSCINVLNRELVTDLILFRYQKQSGIFLVGLKH